MLRSLTPAPRVPTPAARPVPVPAPVVPAPVVRPPALSLAPAEPVEASKGPSSVVPAPPSVVPTPASPTPAALDWTPSQTAALAAATRFLAGEGDVLTLTGAAGTGKTTLVSAVVEAALDQRRSVHLVAPTARAARVLARRTGRATRTAHSHLYVVHPHKDRPGFRLERKPNGDTAPTLLVVDEASLVAARATTDGDLFHSGTSLLDDLVAHVRAGRPGSQIVFVGDTCQLPPVLEDVSLALDADALATRFGLVSARAHLTEIVRQAAGSPILQAAHALRDRIEAATDGRAAMPALDLPRLTAYGAPVRTYLDASDGGRDPEGAVILASANKSVQRYNADVRRALDRTGDLDRGDLVVLDADAFPPGSDRSTPALRRGTPLRVAEVGAQIERVADLAFCRVVLEPVGDDAGEAVEMRACLTHLTSDKGLSSEQERNLFADRHAKNPDFGRNAHPADDPYVGALRLRYGHALTTHKAQGGEWGTVVVDTWQHPSNEGTAEALRWLYTAVTRARDTCLLRDPWQGPRR